MYILTDKTEALFLLEIEEIKAHINRYCAMTKYPFSP